MQISLIYISFLSFSLECTDLCLIICAQIKCLITHLTSNLTTSNGLGCVFIDVSFATFCVLLWSFSPSYSSTVWLCWSLNGLLTRTFNRSVRINIRAANTIDWTLVTCTPKWKGIKWKIGINLFNLSYKLWKACDC